MDGSCRALGRCFDKGAEQDIGKRVEPGLHRDHVRTDDSWVRGIYGNALVLQSASSWVNNNNASLVLL